MRLAVGDGSEDAWVETVIATTDPESTTKSAIDWFLDVQAASGPLVSLGIASFGPLDLRAGAIAPSTPKTAWGAWPLHREVRTGPRRSRASRHRRQRGGARRTGLGCCSGML